MCFDSVLGKVAGSTWVNVAHGLGVERASPVGRDELRVNAVYTWDWGGGARASSGRNGLHVCPRK